MKRCFLKITSILIILSVTFISGCRKKNRPPHTPYTPTGPSVGSINNNYNFHSLAIDPEGDKITMRFDWGDGDTSVWASDDDLWVTSEQTITQSHFWSSLDTFYIRAQAKDTKENASEWSMPHCFVITPNQPPNVPLITGPSSGCIKTSYQFSGSAIDPDSDEVAIRFNWGDGDTSNWSKWKPSGISIWMSHSWFYPDTYFIQAQAKDSFGAISEWSLPSSIEIKNQTVDIVWICATPSAVWDPRESHATVVFDNKIWVVGGHWTTDNVWFSPDGVNWTRTTPLAGFGTRYDFPMVVFDNKIWVIGGLKEGVEPRSDVWCSTDGVNWTCVTDSAKWSPRIEHTAVVFNNKIWVLGGTDSFVHGKPFRDVWFSVDGINWTCATRRAGWGKRNDHTAVVFDNKIWVIGGLRGDTCMNDVWYSTDGRHWFQSTDSAPWSVRFAHTSVVFDNKMWVLGGLDFEGILNDVWSSPDGEFWVCETSLTIFPERWDHTSVVFDNKIWVLGGGPPPLIGLNDIWYRDSIYGK